MIAMHVNRAQRGCRALRHSARVVGLLIGIGAVVSCDRRAAEDASRSGTAHAASGTMANMPGMSMPAGAKSGAASTGAAHLTADQIRQFGVTFAVAEQRMLTNEVRAPGIVTVDSSRIVQVAPRFGGFVERLYVRAAGQPVRRGQPLMDVYSPELVAAEQELLVAANLQRGVAHSDIPGVPASGPDLVAAARERLALWDISASQVDAILRSGRARRTLTLFAPASGTVLDKNVVEGQAIQAGQMLYTIADLASVWVDTELREADAGSVRPGARAVVETPASPGHSLAGRVTYVYPTLDPAARAIRARVSVVNSAGTLKPGMYATVTLASPSRTALTVPASAILRTGVRDIVFVDMGSGELAPHDVDVGRTAGDYTEVVSGLAPGQRVVTSAQYLLDSESNLAEVMKSMISNMGAGSQTSGAAGNASGMSSMPGMTMPAQSSTPRR